MSRPLPEPDSKVNVGLAPLTASGRSVTETTAGSHRRAKARVRFGVGVWLLALAAYLCYSGSWWGLLLIVPAALRFYLGYRLQRSVQS